MPRPKRTKVAPSAPTRTSTRVSRVADASDASIISKTPKTIPTSSVAQIEAQHSPSGNSDAVPITSRSARTRTTRHGGARQVQSEVVDTENAPAEVNGERAKEDAPKKNVRKRGRMAARKTLGTQDEKTLEALKKRRDEALRKEKGEEENPQPMSAAARLAARRASAGSAKTSSPAVQRTETSELSPAVRRTARGVPSSPAVGSAQRSTAIATSSPQRPAVPQSAMKAPPSAVKAQGTPAVETSVLALSKFKRRPRQPSILRMVQQTSDHEPDDEIEETLGDFDFDPDDESTPLKLNPKGAARTSLGATPGTTSKVELRTSSSRKRKLRSPQQPEEQEQEQPEDSEIQVPRSSPPIVERPGAPTRELEDTGDDDEHLYSEASDLPQQVVKNTQDRHEQSVNWGEETPGIYSETMAPPKSTSSLLDGYESPRHTDKTPAKRRRQPARARSRAHEVEDADGVESEEEETTPVQKRKSTRNAKKAKPSALSTATLQSLLPRRRNNKRNKHTDPFDIPSSDEIEAQELSSDEDELQHPPTRRGGRTARGKTLVTAATAGKKKRQHSPAAAKGKAKAQTKSASRPSRTYGRRSSDKENTQNDETIHIRGQSEDEDEGETTETPQPSAKSKELSAAARKFAEIDRWEMEFESVDHGGNSASSPWR